MNILHINNFHYIRGGSEAVYFKTAEMLEKCVHKSLFFSMKHPENSSCGTGLLFEAENAADLAEKINCIYGTPELPEAMCENAGNYVEEEHNEEKYYQKLMGIYQLAINNKTSTKG